LLQNHGSDERRLQTVRGLVADDLAKGSEGVPVQLPVVGQPAQELLDLFRGAVSLDNSPLFAGEDVWSPGRLGHGPTIVASQAWPQASSRAAFWVPRSKRPQAVARNTWSEGYRRWVEGGL
jgi:hypothetical protein